MLKRLTLFATILGAALVAAAALHAQQTPGKPASLSPADYIEIQQLGSRYAYAIDNCLDNGYNYADLYTPDGTFQTSQAGRLGRPWQGRDRLAEAARGNTKSCDEVARTLFILDFV